MEKKIKETYESFWLYSESHPWRLAQHITARGVLMGTTIGVLGGLPYSIIKKRSPVLLSVGSIALRGGTIGGVVLGLVAAERCYHFNKEQVGDRAYRISYNWGQTKWDYIALDGGLLGALFFRRPFGGVLPAAAVGSALGTLLCVASMVGSKVLA